MAGQQPAALAALPARFTPVQMRPVRAVGQAGGAQARYGMGQFAGSQQYSGNIEAGLVGNAPGQREEVIMTGAYRLDMRTDGAISRPE